jgi:hypothetical protein
MELNLKDIQDAHAQALFANGDTVTIQLFDKERNDVTPALLADTVCVQFGTTGIFQWPYANLDSFPVGYEEYTWTMTNQLNAKQIDIDSFASIPSTFLQIPFDINIWEQTVNKADDWQPEFRIDSNSSGLKVSIELTDGTTTIYKATSNVTDRGDGEAGGDDQILLLAEMDTFQYFRLLVSGTETESFGSRFMDLKISVKTSNDIVQTPTVRKKIGFTEQSAIKIGP